MCESGKNMLEKVFAISFPWIMGMFNFNDVFFAENLKIQDLTVIAICYCCVN